MTTTLKYRSVDSKTGAVLAEPASLPVHSNALSFFLQHIFYKDLENGIVFKFNSNAEIAYKCCQITRSLRTPKQETLMSAFTLHTWSNELTCFIDTKTLNSKLSIEYS